MKGRDSLDDPESSSSRCPLEGFYTLSNPLSFLFTVHDSIPWRVSQSFPGTQVMLVSELVVRSDVAIELSGRYGAND